MIFLEEFKMRTKIFAHRGYSEIYPENTMMAFSKAIEVGADGIETDVQMTKDGVLVLIHDEQIDRTSNGIGLVKDISYSELLNYDFGEWKNRSYSGQRIVTLDEMLKLIKKYDVELNIEIKNNIIKYHGIEDKIIDLIRKYDIENKILISSFNHESIQRIKTLNTEIRCGVLCYSNFIDPHEYVRKLGVDTYHPMYRTLSTKIIKDLERYNIPIYTYTVDEENDIKRLIEAKVECIITNRVQEALKYVK